MDIQFEGNQRLPADSSGFLSVLESRKLGIQNCDQPEVSLEKQTRRGLINRIGFSS